jgi:arsenate reductase
MTTIYHNPRCGKSRDTLKLLNEKDEDITIVEYLKNIPNAQTLKDILVMLDISAYDLIRKGEKIYKENYKGKEMSEDEWIIAMVKNPILIERPIVVKGNKAALGRPPEQVLEIL